MKDIVSEGQWSVWYGKQMKWILWLSSFQTEAHGGVAQVEHGKLPELMRQSQQIRDARASRVHRKEYWREERLAERQFQTSAEGPWMFSRVLIRPWVTEAMQSQRKNHLQGLKYSTYTKLVIVAIPTNQIWKLVIHGTFW